MRTALCWGTIRNLGLVDLARTAAAAGFTDITVTPGMYEHARRGNTDDQLRRHLGSLGVGVAVIDPLISALPGAPDPDKIGGPYAETFAWTEELAVEAALGLECGLVSLAHYRCEPRPRGEMVDALAAIADRAGRHGLSLAVEAIPESGTITSNPVALDLVTATDATNIGLMYDTWHEHRARPAEDPDLPDLPVVSAIAAIQVSDAPAELRGIGPIPAGADRLLPGEGTIPLRAILSAIAEHRPGAPVSVEVISSRLAALDPVEAATLCRTALAGVLEPRR